MGLYYIMCCGCGKAPCCNPLQHYQLKACCCIGHGRCGKSKKKIKKSTCAHVRAKFLWFAASLAFPPTSDIGIAFCNNRLYGGEPDSEVEEDGEDEEEEEE